jgi:hypothetical protein
MKDLVSRIFTHWQVIHEAARSKLDQKRDKAIRDRIRDGYTEQDLIDAIEGCALSEFHMGGNDRRQKYNDLCLICRDAAHVDKFIEEKERAQRERARAQNVLQRADPDAARRGVIELRNRLKVG